MTEYRDTGLATNALGRLGEMGETGLNDLLGLPQLIETEQKFTGK